MKKIKHRFKFMLFLSIGIVFFSILSYRCMRIYDYDFYIDKCDIHVFTKKKCGGKFLVMFAENVDSLKYNYKEVDYIETETGAYVRIIFEKANRKNITIHVENKPSVLNRIKYNIELIDQNNEQGYGYMIDKFYEKNNGWLKYEQYLVMRLDTKEYHVTLEGEVVHQGNILGR